MPSKLLHSIIIFSVLFLLFGLSTSETKKDSHVDSLSGIYKLLNQSDSLRDVARFDSALVLLNRTLEESHRLSYLPDTTLADIYQVFGLYHFDLGNYPKSNLFWDSVLIIREKHGDSNINKYADILIKLGYLNIQLARTENGDQLLQKALSILNENNGDSQLKAECYMNLISVSLEKGEFDEADSLVEKAFAICEKNSEFKSQNMADCLTRLGDIYYNKGEYEPADSIYKKALDIYTEIYRPEHPRVATSLNNIGNIQMAKGDFAAAESLFVKVIALRKRSLGKMHTQLGVTMNSLANLYWMMGTYAEIEPYLKQAINIFETALGPEHPELGTSVNCLAALYYVLGRLNEADSLFEQALRITRKILGPNHHNVGTILNNLGYINTKLGNYEKAENYLTEALEVRKNLLGAEHPRVANSHMAIALLLSKRKKYDESEFHLKEALAIREKTLGLEHPEVAKTLYDLAGVYHSAGEYEKAEVRYKESLAIWDKTPYSLNPNVSLNIKSLARLYADIGNHDLSLKYYKRFLDLAQKLIEYAFSYSSESQKIRWINQYPIIDNSLLTMAVKYNTERSANLALEMILKGKASVIDAVMAEKKMAYCIEGEAVTEMLEKHKATRTEIANLVLTGYKNLSQDIYNDSLLFLYNIQESLEAELSRQCFEFKNDLETKKYGVAEAAGVLPENAVLLEFLKYVPQKSMAADRGSEASEQPRYLAFTLNHSKKVSLVDLGPARVIDSLVDLCRTMIYNSDSRIFLSTSSKLELDLKKITKKLYALLMSPVISNLDNQADIYISPDSKLNLLPFEILTNPDDSYLIEKYRFCYLSSGRDLFKFSAKKTGLGNAIILADPDFDYKEPDNALLTNSVSSSTGNVIFAMDDNPARSSVECFEAGFPSLRYSQKEMRLIKQTLEQVGNLRVQNFMGSQASEEILKTMNSVPSILHIVTHGFFCESSDSTEETNTDNPLLRSGLALAGANQSSNGASEDGILTAYEVSGLNLIDTDLAALSACETGVGETLSGEGVFGLRRAFKHAGVQSILISLWKIPDKETSELMEGFYTRWLGGQTKVDALRESALNMMKKSQKEFGHTHPLLWGGFVLTGNPN